MASMAAIEVWRSAELAGLELSQGVSVTRTVPPHWHEEYQVCVITKGGGDLLYKGVRHPTPAGTMFAIHPGEVHANETSWVEGCSYRTFNLEAEMMERLVGQRFRLQPLITDAEVIRAFLGSFSTIQQGAPRLAMEGSLLISLTGLIGRYGGGMMRATPAPRQVELVREYLTEHYTRNVSLSELSELTGLSPFHLTRTFKDRVGVPPHRFQIGVRLERAKELLRCGRPVARVAADCGFVDQSHLVKSFKRVVGVTPGEYRGDRKIVQSTGA